MVNPGLTINLFDFQEQTVIKLVDLTVDKNSKQTIIVKAPTGAGKTIILIDYIEEYLYNVESNMLLFGCVPVKGI